MEIEKIDKNFEAKNAVCRDGKITYTLPCEPFDVYGVFYDQTHGRFLRMPWDTAESVNGGVFELNKHTAGGRVRFSTDSDYFELTAEFDAFTAFPHMAQSGSSCFSIMEETENGNFPSGSLICGHYSNNSHSDGKSYTVSIPLAGGKMRNYILYFPLYNDVKSLKITLSERSRVDHGRKYRNIKPILYYGSSITQGGCASRPDNSYQALISKWNDIDFVNLGFSGSALGERVMAEYLAGIDCSIFVMDYDHNAPTAGHLAETHEKFFGIYRQAHPDTPVILATMPTVNRRDEWASARFDVINKTYKNAVRSGDKNVYLIDGRNFYGKADRECCTVDACHPNDLGFYLMAKAFYKVICRIYGKTDE